MLQLQNVRKTYKTKAGTVNALDGVSLTFPTSGLVFITGKSGCGKTTLLNVIGGLDGIDEGEILIQDKKFSEFSAAEYDSYRNTFIGFIFQEYNLLPEFTVEKNIKMAMELQGRKADDTELEKLLKDVEIEKLKKRKPSELSGGQRQRVAIARALVKQPRIIMADEPTGALDSGTGVQVLDTLKKLSKKTLVIVVSHDREFAEKYADRIIHLEDGRVTQDVTFTEKEIESNVSEQGNTLVVREGADLSESEKDALAKAVKERKSIEIIENPCFRDKRPTGKVEHSVDDPVSLRKSRMKLKSAAHLGVKSLAVKPVRLVLTVLISALAFAVFGICDTIANFNTSKILKNQLKIAPSKTVVATTDYVVDQKAEDSYVVKVSDDTVAALQSQTGGKVKGIFDFEENRGGNINDTFTITELSSASVSSGRQYYTKEINGFIEFDNQEEISKDGSFKDFGYKLVHGRYPDPVYGNNGALNKPSLYEIAISTYLADSIIHYLDGKAINQKIVDVPKDLLNVNITVAGQQYTIVGIIDCGTIPAKYDTLSRLSVYTKEYNSLIDDFKGYIDSGAQKCIFVAKDFLKAIQEDNNAADIYHVGNVNWRLYVGNDMTGTETETYLYNAEDYGTDNILLFNGEYPQNGKITLADDEVLIHSDNLEKLFTSKINKLQTTDERTSMRKLITGLNKGTAESNRDALAQIFAGLNIDLEQENLNARIRQRFLKTNDTVDKEVKIVGVYFGIDPDSYTFSSRYKLMMNTNLMEELGVFSEQGNYSKLLFSAGSIRKGSGAIANYLLSDDGLSMTWYNNSVLKMIRDNEPTIRQGAKLFLYADLALSLFAIFMLYNYMSTSIASKKQSVGILRALGAGGKDILRTFLSESLIVSVVNGVLANLFAVLGCMLVNAYIVGVMNISVHFALFGIRQIVSISAISLLTAIVSSLLPIIKISKKKPVELIRRP